MHHQRARVHLRHRSLPLAASIFRPGATTSLSSTDFDRVAGIRACSPTTTHNPRHHGAFNDDASRRVMAARGLRRVQPAPTSSSSRCLRHFPAASTAEVVHR